MNPCLKFAHDQLFQNVKTGPPTNIAISPLSLNAMVAMLGAGSSGRTLDRVLSFAGTESLDELKSHFSKTMSIVNNSGSPGSPKISFVNGAWSDKRFPLKVSYQKCLRDTFKSEAKIHDFLNQAGEAVRDINSWAELHTNGLIKGVIGRQHINPLTAVVLGNALYFRGSWSNKFDSHRTMDRNFYLVNGDKISNVPFMTDEIPHLYGAFGDFKILELPYRTGKKKKNDHYNFSMQFILPRKRDGLQSLLEKFNSDSDLLTGNFELRPTNLDAFWIPKFNFSYSLDSVRFPFMDEGEHMELTEMLHEQAHGVPPVITQKAVIEVDEEGTEAAAVTFCFANSCVRFAPPKPKLPTFVADHPFKFIIKENTTGLVLFTGTVLNPQDD